MSNLGKYLKAFFLSIFLGVFFTTMGQSLIVDFEESENWETKNSYWSVGSDRARSGTQSLKISLSNDNLKGRSAVISIDTDHTILKVRTAKGSAGNIAIGSSYEGALFGISYSGNILWKNELSGFMIHDIWAADLTGDGKDEIVVANADGGIYCLDIDGELLWTWKSSEVPMYAVTVVHKEGVPYVVCGGFDLNIYYLSSTGSELLEVPSSAYSIEKPWGDNKPPNFLHYANFLRPVRQAGGTEILALHGSNNHMQGKGTLYLFDVLEEEPFNKIPVGGSIQIGEFRLSDVDGNGVDEIVLGFSGHQKETKAVRFDLNRDLTASWGKDDWEEYPYRLAFGYSVLQPELISDEGEKKYMFLVGNDLILGNADFQPGDEEVLTTKYSYNDMWKDGQKIILASAQSGGSCIHILDTSHEDWKSSYVNLNPPGKIQKIITNTEEYRSYISAYEKPANERELLPVYLMTENTDDGLASSVAEDIRLNYSSPVFLGGTHMSQAENWDRSSMANEKYKNKRDARRNYAYTQQQAIDHITPWYSGEQGIAYWGGHGNDPYMFQRSTTEQVIDFANGKKTVLIYPELEDHSSDFEWVMDDLFYPLAEYSTGRNTNIFVRTKHNFWQANVYLPMWERMLDGEFPDVFVPSMEETTDKAMDISIAGRVGVWASGAVNQWGTRAVPDNPSFDRSRQFSHQTLPNHFMRHIIYHLSYGAQYINNFSVDQDYMSFIWELIAKGALYIPKLEEIVSFSPVHLGMKEPDEHYLVEGSSLKWSTFYDPDFESQNPFVFSRQNATWVAAKVNDWDFSSYAGGVKDRRQNFLPNYPNGLVLITPPQNGIFAKQNVPRGLLKDRLHPLYSEIMEEYITDGRQYISRNGTQTFDADVYASTIKMDLEEKVEKLPISVSGNVAWVAAQTSPRHIRLTIIDGGYLNPNDRKAKVKFHSVVPVGMTDILDGKTFNVDNQEALVDIPCGLFRFIDVELSNDL